MSIIDPLSFEFAKTFCYHVFIDRTWTNHGNNTKHQQSEILREQFDSFKSQLNVTYLMWLTVNSIKRKHWRHSRRNMRGKVKQHSADCSYLKMTVHLVTLDINKSSTMTLIWFLIYNVFFFSGPMLSQFHFEITRSFVYVRVFTHLIKLPNVHINATWK